MARQKQKHHTHPYIRYSKRPDLAFYLQQKRFKPITIVKDWFAFDTPAVKKCYSLSELKDCCEQYGAGRYDLDITKFSFAEQRQIFSQLDDEIRDGKFPPQTVISVISNCYISNCDRLD